MNHNNVELIKYGIVSFFYYGLLGLFILMAIMVIPKEMRSDSITQNAMAEVIESDKTEDSLNNISSKYNNENDDFTVDVYKIDECYYVSVEYIEEYIDKSIENYGKCIIDEK